MFFEKIFAPKDADNKEKLKKESDPKSEISLGKFAKIAAVLAMLALPQEANAQEKPNYTEGNKEKTEQASLNLNKLINFVKESQASVNVQINNIEAKELNISEEHQLTVALDGRYTILSKDGGKRTYFDINSDGRLDRLVINNKSYEEEGSEVVNSRRNMENCLFIFSSLEDLKSQLDVVSSLTPEPITVIDLNNKKQVVTMINHEDGSLSETPVDKPEYGAGFIEKTQSVYANELAKAVKEIK